VVRGPGGAGQGGSGGQPNAPVAVEQHHRGVREVLGDRTVGILGKHGSAAVDRGRLRRHPSPPLEGRILPETPVPLQTGEIEKRCVHPIPLQCPVCPWLGSLAARHPARPSSATPRTPSTRPSLKGLRRPEGVGAGVCSRDPHRRPRRDHADVPHPTCRPRPEGSLTMLGLAGASRSSSSAVTGAADHCPARLGLWHLNGLRPRISGRPLWPSRKTGSTRRRCPRSRGGRPGTRGGRSRHRRG
jgi:hypothetical protein